MPFGVTSCKPQPGPAAGGGSGGWGPFARSHPLSEPVGAQHACLLLPLTQRSLTETPEALIRQSNNPRREGGGGWPWRGGQQEGAGVQVGCAGWGQGNTSLPQPPLGLPALGAERLTLWFWHPGTSCHPSPVHVHKCGNIPLHQGVASGWGGDAGDASQRLIQHAATIPPRITSLGYTDSTRASRYRQKIPAAPARVRDSSVRWHRRDTVPHRPCACLGMGMVKRGAGLALEGCTRRHCLPAHPELLAE